MPNTEAKPPGAKPGQPGTKVEVGPDGKPVPGGKVVETTPDTGHLPPTTPGSHGNEWEKKKKKS